MAQNREKGGRVVFIGNIPYGVSEEQICDIFGRIGAVLSFRLVYDKETGKPKGFGFLEYGDTDAAASAVRNLNGFEIMGRELKVDYSNDNSGKRDNAADGQQGSGRAPPPPHFNMNMSAPNGVPGTDGGAPAVLPQLPPGVDLPPGMQAPDAISRTLQTIPAPQLLDILSQMKGLATSDPQKATQLLAGAPQLSYAIFQALILLGLVDTNILGSLLQQQPGQQAPPQQQPPMPQPGYPPQQLPHPAYPQQPPPMQNQYAPPPQQSQYPPYQHQQHPGYAPTPPAPQPAWQPPQQQAPPPYQQPPPPQQQQPDQNAQLIQQVLAMTREQIMQLDDGPRNQIMALRAQLGAPLS